MAGPRGQRERLNECYTLEGLSWFQHSWNALSDLGSVALTPVSTYTFTLACASVTGKRTMCLWTCTTESERKYVMVTICLHCSSIQQKLFLTFTHIPAPRHFRNSTSAPRPSLLQWLHSKQTCLKENPCSLSTKGKGDDSLLNLFLGLYLVLSAIQLSIFSKTFVLSCASISLQSEYLLCEMQCNTGITVYSDSQLAVITWHRPRVSESVVMWYPIIDYYNTTYSLLY